LSKVTPGGRNSGSITLAMKSAVISGTPRQSSMNIFWGLAIRANSVL
jgi:hypothetical protein